MRRAVERLEHVAEILGDAHAREARQAHRIGHHEAVEARRHDVEQERGRHRRAHALVDHVGQRHLEGDAVPRGVHAPREAELAAPPSEEIEELLPHLLREELSEIDRRERAHVDEDLPLQPAALSHAADRLLERGDADALLPQEELPEALVDDVRSHVHGHAAAEEDDLRRHLAVHARARTATRGRHRAHEATARALVGDAAQERREGSVRERARPVVLRGLSRARSDEAALVERLRVGREPMPRDELAFVRERRHLRARRRRQLVIERAGRLARHADLSRRDLGAARRRRGALGRRQPGHRVERHGSERHGSAGQRRSADHDARARCRREVSERGAARRARRGSVAGRRVRARRSRARSGDDHARRGGRAEARGRYGRSEARARARRLAGPDAPRDASARDAEDGARRARVEGPLRDGRRAVHALADLRRGDVVERRDRSVGHAVGDARARAEADGSRDLGVGAARRRLVAEVRLHGLDTHRAGDHRRGVEPLLVHRSRRGDRLGRGAGRALPSRLLQVVRVRVVAERERAFVVPVVLELRERGLDRRLVERSDQRGLRVHAQRQHLERRRDGLFVREQHDPHVTPAGRPPDRLHGRHAITARQNVLDEDRVRGLLHERVDRALTVVEAHHLVSVGRGEPLEPRGALLVGIHHEDSEGAHRSVATGSRPHARVEPVPVSTSRRARRSSSERASVGASAGHSRRGSRGER